MVGHQDGEEAHKWRRWGTASRVGGCQACGESLPTHAAHDVRSGIAGCNEAVKRMSGVAV